MAYCAYCGNSIQEGYGYRVPVGVQGALINFHLACGQPFRDDMLRIEQGHRMERLDPYSGRPKVMRIHDLLAKLCRYEQADGPVIGPADPMEVLHEQAE